MELAQDKIDLISEIIRNDRKYAGNEDLFEDFLNEACARAFSIISTISDSVTLESYLRRVVSTAVLNVLKDSGRLRRASSGYVPRKEVPIEPAVPKKEEPVTVDYSNILIKYSDVEIPETPENVAIQNDLISFVSSAVRQINADFPEQKFMELYNLRYEKGYTQKEIASELGISQSEVSKRLYDLMDKVKEAMD